MEIVFLGTGSAWCLPEYSCTCAVCRKLVSLGEQRTRTSILVRSLETVLIDCGPDVRPQMIANRIERPDLILITHEHGDHYLGLDDLSVFRGCMPKGLWEPIPVYASEQAWKTIELRFGYLLDNLIEKRLAVPDKPLEGTKTLITPFKTFHGPFASGSVGYVLEEATEGRAPLKLVYTSDFSSLEAEPSILFEPDVLVIQSHWFNEPKENRPNHLSFQRAVDFIKRWKPRKAAYLVHISDNDQIPGDPCNTFLKKFAPLSPLSYPQSGKPYPVPLCRHEWQNVVDLVAKDYGLPCPVIVSYDGMTTDMS